MTIIMGKSSVPFDRVNRVCENIATAVRQSQGQIDSLIVQLATAGDAVDHSAPLLPAVFVWSGRIYSALVKVRSRKNCLAL